MRQKLIRKILRDETHLEEYSGFVSFDKFCVFCVLLTPEELKTKNIRKLEYCIERIIPVDVHLQSFAQTEILTLKRHLDKTKSDEEKANILISIAEIHRDMNEIDEAKNKYNESIEVFPNNYGARLGLLEMGFNTEKRNQLIDSFYAVSPGNLQICDDLLGLSIQHKQHDFLEEFFGEKVKEHEEEFEKLGCIYLCWADLYYTIEKEDKGLKYFKLSKDNFEKCFDDNHPMVLQTKEAIIELGE